MAGRVLVVAATIPFVAPLQAAVDRLTNVHGCTVTARADTVDPVAVDDEADFDAAWVTGGVSEAFVAGEYAEHALALVLSKGSLTDDNGFSAEGSGSSARDDIKIVDNSHPITSGLSLGDLTVATAADNMEHATAPAAGTILATGSDAQSENAEIRLSVIETGEARTGAFGNAPATRIFYYFRPDAHDADVQNAAGWDVFDRVWTYALPSVPYLYRAWKGPSGGLVPLVMRTHGGVQLTASH